MRAAEARALRVDERPVPETAAGLGARDLRWLADAYEQAQRVRLGAGERIRAILQRRDAAGVSIGAAQVDAVLHAIRTGTSDGPVPLLGRTYRMHSLEERELRTAMSDALADHPAWPWLSSLRGMGPTLAGKLLGRLCLDRAPTPSSFWAYCGLATVPAPDRPGRRIAQPRTRGVRSCYDRYAKKICYQVGTSFLRAGGPYADYYRAERARLERSRSEWTRAHVHLAALRKMEKLFLAHLWQVWTEAVGRPALEPYPLAVQRRTARIPPPPD